jgi:Rad3-related DNA helicase
MNDTTTLHEDLAHLFSASLPRALRAYEPRASQQVMAHAVADTLVQGGSLLVEAPTGIGKSLAYLLPAALYAADTGKTVLVSTYTKALEDQLLHDDIPLLGRVVGRPLEVAVMRGRANYLCLQRWHAAEADGVLGRAVHPDVATWVGTTHTGYFGELPFTAGLRALSADVSSAVCQECSLNPRCFLMTQRRRAFRAQIVIVNHALLLADMAAGGVLLPNADVLIADEAHRLPEVARGAWRVTLARHAVEPHVRAFVGDGRQGGTVGVLRRLVRRGVRQATRANALLHAERAGAAMSESAAALGRFEAALAQLLHAGGMALTNDLPRLRLRPAGAGRLLAGPRSAAVTIEYPEEEASAVVAHMESAVDELGALRDVVADLTQTTEDAEGALVELATAHETWARMRDAARGTLGNIQDGAVRWIERAGVADGAPADPAERSATLVSVPENVPALVGRALSARLRALVLTSATLAPGGDFAYPLAQLGLVGSNTLPVSIHRLPSPFPLADTLSVAAPRNAPAPGTPEHDRALADFLAALQERVRRNTLALCTSYATVRALSRALRPRALSGGWPLWVQGEDGGPRALVEEFRGARGALLIGTASLWEGIDLPGEECEIVVLSRLPFAVPTDPLIEALAEREAEEGREPFWSVHLPSALLRLVQGAGRVIRRSTDRGAVIIADPRILTRSYGAAFQDALDVPTLACANLEEIVEHAARWFNTR